MLEVLAVGSPLCHVLHDSLLGPRPASGIVEGEEELKVDLVRSVKGQLELVLVHDFPVCHVERERIDVCLGSQGHVIDPVGLVVVLSVTDLQREESAIKCPVLATIGTYHEVSKHGFCPDMSGPLQGKKPEPQQLHC